MRGDCRSGTTAIISACLWRCLSLRADSQTAVKAAAKNRTHLACPKRVVLATFFDLKLHFVQTDFQ